MKIHDAPKVILLARPSIDWAGVAEFLAEYGMGVDDWRRGSADRDGESLPELAGRACYGSFGERQGRTGAADYMEHVIGSGHGSVLEHGQWTFAVCRASRGFTHQMVRHRAGFAFSQESQHFIRYSREDAEPGSQEAALCVAGVPAEYRDIALDAASDALDAYSALWKALRSDFPPGAKVKKAVSERARGLLPCGMESRLVFSANARALRHFCELRGTAENALEIRLVAARVAQLMKEEAPAIFQDFEIGDAEDGLPTVSSRWRKA